MPVRLALVEDRPEVRRLLAERLGFFDDVELVLVASSAESFFERLDRLRALPEVVLMDIELPGIDGISATERLKAAHPDIDVLMLTVFEDEDRIFTAVKAGASGYLLKDDSAGRVVGAVLEAARGGAPVSPVVAKKLLGYVRGESTAADAFPITPRERDVLALIVEGLIEEAIADRLCISPHTVRGHVKSLYEKLQVHSRAEVVRAAYERRLVR